MSVRVGDLTTDHVGLEAQVVEVAGGTAHHTLDTARLLGGRGLIVAVLNPGTDYSQLQIDWNPGMDERGLAIREAARETDDAWQDFEPRGLLLAADDRVELAMPQRPFAERKIGGDNNEKGSPDER